MKKNTKILALFDIDGTLIDTGGAGKHSFTLAFQDCFGIPSAFDSYSMCGKTDTLILDDVFFAQFARYPTQRERRKFWNSYLAHLTNELKKRKSLYKVLAGVRQTLKLLQHHGILTGLATGNIEKGARLKLEPGGLNNFFPFGGFGSDASKRWKMVHIAYHRGMAFAGTHIPVDKVFVIGDSPLDVYAAKKAGVKSVAILTGMSDPAAVEASNPDYLLKDLTDPQRLFGILTGGNPQSPGKSR